MALVSFSGFLLQDPPTLLTPSNLTHPIVLGGKYVGTLMYERCYAPPSFDEEEIAAALDALENISD